MLVRQSQFPLGADHAQGGNTANLPFAQLAQLPRVGIDELGADLGERDRLSLSEVGSAANHLQRFVRAELDRGES